MNTSSKPARRPTLLWLSVASMLLTVPSLWLLDRFSGYCADGLCTFWYGTLILLGGLLAAIVLAITGWVRGERPRWIPLLSLLVLIPLAKLLGMF